MCIEAMPWVIGYRNLINLDCLPYIGNLLRQVPLRTFVSQIGLDINHFVGLCRVRQVNFFIEWRGTF
jgi:hypothetical protein